jgi:hypothetical protein
MATTLRGFQNEIEQIHERELAKQRAEGRIALEKDKHKDKAPQAGKLKEPATSTTESIGRLDDNDEDDSHNTLQVCYSCQFVRFTNDVG